MCNVSLINALSIIVMSSLFNYCHGVEKQETTRVKVRIVPHYNTRLSSNARHGRCLSGKPLAY